MNTTRLCLRAVLIFLLISIMLGQTCITGQAAKAPQAVQGISDTRPPSIPGGLTAVNRTCTSILLSWEKSGDNVEVKGYQVFRDGRKIVSTSKTSYTNTDLVPGREYTYTIKAYDAAGNVSESSTALCAATISDTQPPSVPGALSVTSVDYTSVVLSWKPSTDNNDIKGYDIYCDGSKAASTPGTYYVCKGLAPGKTYSFSVKAYDIAGNCSMLSSNITAVTPADTVPPSIPYGLKASTVSETEIGLVWSASSDNVKVKGYEVYCDGQKIGSSSDTSYSSKGLIPGRTYTYTVRACDTAGNTSASSSTFKITTLKDLAAPTAPTGLKVNSRKGSYVALAWNASTDNIKVKGYQIYCNGIKVDTATRTSCTVKSPFGLGFDIYWVKAFDLADNYSTGSNSVPVITFK